MLEEEFTNSRDGHADGVEGKERKVSLGRCDEFGLQVR